MYLTPFRRSCAANRQHVAYQDKPGGGGGGGGHGAPVSPSTEHQKPK